VEVICRDRAGAYAEAARAGAPRAVQVADRWHIWHNLCEYAGQAVARHQGCLGGPGCAGPGQPQEREQEQEQEQEERAAGVPAGLEAVIRQRHAAVRQLRAGGATLPEAAAALGLSRQTAGRFWRAPGADALLKARSVSALDPWKPYLRRRWDAGITTIAVLHREITALGYAGSEPTTYAWLALLKLAAPPKPPAPPSRQQVTHRSRRTGRRPPGTAHRHPRPLPRAGSPGRARHRLRQDPHPPRRRPPRQLARRRGDQPWPARARIVRHRHPPRLPGRPQRPDPGMELRPRRRPQHPDQDAVE
jgi:hypothetical protein